MRNHTGVFPAITTPFQPDGQVDHPQLARHAQWMLDHGCAGIICCGSLGEGNTLSYAEKLAVVTTCVQAAGTKPVVVGVAGLSTQDAVALARGVAELGAHGLMVLPPYVYAGDEGEMCGHVSAVIAATALDCMLYNNPLAYRVDFSPEAVAGLAQRHPNLVSIKESSGDVRRFMALRSLLGERLQLGVGVDDGLFEGVAMGASFWVAGMVNAFPAESVALFELARAGHAQEAAALYQWFLPLLRLDTVGKFVQHIKVVQHAVGCGSAAVRAPRLQLSASELRGTLELLRRAQENPAFTPAADRRDGGNGRVD